MHQTTSSIPRPTSNWNCRPNPLPFQNGLPFQNNGNNRAKTAGTYSKEERERQLLKFEEERQRLQEESDRRKEFLQYIDEIRTSKQQRTSENVDARDPIADEQIRSRVFWAKHEQEDEVKRANRIILAKKVHLVQGAQINEKRELEREWRDAQLQIEKKMLEEDKAALERQKKSEEAKKKFREHYANELRNALEYHDAKKYLEAERIENEAEVIRKAKLALQADEEAKARLKREQVDRIRRDFHEAKEMSTHFKHLAAESKRMAEIKAQEYMRFKAEQHRQLEKEKRLERERKQRETDRILARQTQLLRTKQKQEEYSMRRIQEQKEREFRKRVLEAAKKHQQMLKDIAEGRSKQIDESKRIREKEHEFEVNQGQQILEQVKEFQEQEKTEKEKLIRLKEKYRKEILDQIAWKEKQKKKNHAMTINESAEQKREEERREQNIRRVLESKIKSMREQNMPEHLIRDVERQLNLK